MSTNVAAWAWQREDVKQNEKLLLLFLAEYVDPFGQGSNLKEVLGHAERACRATPQSIAGWFRKLASLGLVNEDKVHNSFFLNVPEPGYGFRFRP